MNWKLLRRRDGSLIEFLSVILRGGIEQNNENPHSGYPFPRLILISIISQRRVQSVTTTLPLTETSPERYCYATPHRDESRALLLHHNSQRRVQSVTATPHLTETSPERYCYTTTHRDESRALLLRNISQRRVQSVTATPTCSV